MLIMFNFILLIKFDSFCQKMLATVSYGGKKRKNKVESFYLLFKEGFLLKKEEMNNEEI